MKAKALVLSALLLSALLLAEQGAPPAYAAGYVVNSLADTIANDGVCTLREAIQEANNGANTDCPGSPSSADDTITFSVSGTIVLRSVLPRIVRGVGMLTIDGGGKIKISGNNSVPVFSLSIGSALILKNLTVTSARSVNGSGILSQDARVVIINSTFSNNTTTAGHGAAIYLFGGRLTISDSTFSDNTANRGSNLDVSFGGAIYNHRGTVTVNNSIFIRNRNTDGNGGAIANKEGTLTVTGSTVFANTATRKGGGIWNSAGGVTISNSTITANGSEGIYNDGGLRVINSLVSENSGAGIRSLDYVYIRDSIISENRGFGMVSIFTAIVENSTFSNNIGGGIWNGGFAVMTITNSTISDNVADIGGGIFNLDRLTVVNSTISNNSARGNGGGIWNNGTLNASFVTIANNSAGASGKGGGIFNDTTGTVNIKNSIVGNNTASTGPNCSGTLTPTGANLATDTMTSCGTTNFAYVASTGAGGLNLGPLQVNAPGTTATHALQSGSAAIDAVTDCTDFLNQQVTTDQRGVSRPQGSLCDVGAYEVQNPQMLSVTINGDGSVTSNPMGINCSTGASGQCTATYDQNTIVQLTPTPGSGWVFASWSGDADCSDGQVTMNTDKACTARFVQQGTIVIQKTAIGDNATFGFTGSGSIGSFSILTSGGSGSKQFALAPGTYTFTENAPPTGWAFRNLVCTDPGGGTTVNLSTRRATVDLDAGETVTCTFTNERLRLLSVTVNGDGSVTSNPWGINCSTGNTGPCTATYDQNRIIRLAPTPGSGWVFASWSGDADCSDGQVTMNTDKACTATFVQQQAIVVIKKMAIGDNATFGFTGSGSIGSFSILTSGGSGSKQFALAPGTYTFTENAPPTGWAFRNLVCTDPDGGTTVNLNTRGATVDLDAGETVTCTFTNERLRLLSVTVNGDGSVTSNPMGINCSTGASGQCTATYDQNTIVQLTPTPGSGWVFASWSGDADCSDGQVTMNTDKACTARFVQQGAIVIQKTAIGDNATFGFTGSGSIGSFSILTSGGSGSKQFALAPGTYTFTENAPPTGWAFRNLVCTDPGGGATVNLSTRRATVDLDAGRRSPAPSQTQGCRGVSSHWRRDEVSHARFAGQGLCLRDAPGDVQRERWTSRGPVALFASAACGEPIPP